VGREGASRDVRAALEVFVIAATGCVVENARPFFDALQRRGKLAA
jgi:hypothetical protein